MGFKFILLTLSLIIINRISSTFGDSFSQHGESCIKIQGGSPCSKTSPQGLPTGLVCINTKCQCESLRHQTFNKELKICQSKVGGHCTSSSENSCIKHATCDISLGETTGICVCKAGSVATKGGKCVGQHGSHCLANSDCAPRLVCREEKCSCPDSTLQHYHPYRLICQSVVGAMCGPKEPCIEGAICQSDDNDEGGFHTCRCKESYRQVGRICKTKLLSIFDNIPSE